MIELLAVQQYCMGMPIWKVGYRHTFFVWQSHLIWWERHTFRFGGTYPPIFFQCNINVDYSYSVSDMTANTLSGCCKTWTLDSGLDWTGSEVWRPFPTVYIHVLTTLYGHINHRYYTDMIPYPDGNHDWCFQSRECEPCDRQIVRQIVAAKLLGLLKHTKLPVITSYIHVH